MEDLKIIGGILLGVVALLVLLFATIWTGVYYVEKNQCYSFGRQSEREVKFVKYTLVTWDCLTPTADGKWISTNNLREFGGAAVIAEIILALFLLIATFVCCYYVLGWLA